MIGKPEIIVGAEVDHIAPADGDVPALVPRDLPLALVEAIRLDAGEDAHQMFGETLVQVSLHDTIRRS
jgi:hypothetical protein